MESSKPVVYFYGCMCNVGSEKEVGHFWYEPDSSHSCRTPETPFGIFPDGTLTPDEDAKLTIGGRRRGQPHGVAQLTQKDGWTAIGFWDRTGDSRGNSNSNFIVQGTYTFEEMCKLAAEAYPELWKRCGAVRLIKDGE